MKKNNLVSSFRGHRFEYYIINFFLSCVTSGILFASYMPELTAIVAFLSICTIIGGIVPICMAASILAKMDSKNVDEINIPEKLPAIIVSSLIVQITFFAVLIYMGQNYSGFYESIYNFTALSGFLL